MECLRNKAWHCSFCASPYPYCWSKQKSAPVPPLWDFLSTMLLPAKGVHQRGKYPCPVQTSLCFTGVPGSAISANEKMGKRSELCTRSKMLVKSEFALSTGCKMSIFFCPCYCFAQCWQSFPFLYGTVRKFTINSC